MRIIQLISILIFIISLAEVSMAKSSIEAPIAKKIDHLYTIHNETRNDVYHWLRDDNWPKVSKQDVIDYLNQENKYAEQYFAPYKKLQDELFNEMKSRIKEDDESYPVKKDNYYYYSRTEKDKNYSISCRKKDNLNAKEEIILDGNELAAGHLAFSMSAFAINKTHDLLAYSVDFDGEERYQIFVKDLNTNSLYKDEVKDTIGNVTWHQNLNGFFYSKLDENWRSTKLYFHKLGTNQNEDILIFEEKDPTFNVGAFMSSDKNYLFIETGSNTEDEVWYIHIDRQDFSPKIIFKRTHDQLYSVDSSHNELYIRINDQGKNFRLVKTSFENLLNKNNWHEIFAHDENIYLTSFDLSKEYIVVNRRIQGINQIYVMDRNGNIKTIKFDEDSYSASGYFPTYDSSLVRLSYSSLTTPASLMEYDFESEKLYTRKTQEIPSGYDKQNYKSERLFAIASDGTKIPISLVYNKNLRTKNTPQPLYLYGYGSYGISISPSFNTNIISMLDRGYIFAIAHIRGGDDLGYHWYEDAKFLNKKITFTDFITCSEHLIQHNYTNPKSLIISGGSAGGMLVTAVTNQRPDLFRAVIALVPFVDVLNTMLDETLPLTPGEFKEWGNPKNKEFYDYIKSYSPYDNIKEQNYPAMYITAGISDPRVTYWEPAKFVAKLRTHNLSKNPIIFYTEMESGHQGPSGRYNSLKEVAKIYSFAISIMNNPNQ